MKFVTVLLNIHNKSVRKANSKPELSQLLFISIRQRELIRVLAALGLSTYTTFSWSVHSLPVTPTKLCDIMCCDMCCDMTFPYYLQKNKEKEKKKKKKKLRCKRAKH